jgi:arylsulfatase
MMTGKWHAGTPDPRSGELFDRAFGFLGGATDSFVGGNDWFLDDKPFRDFGNDFYSTHAFADRSIEFMRESVSKQQPFLMYVAFNAPHHPCQAPKQTVEKYLETYRRGYEVLRQERQRQQVALGLIDSDWAAAPVGNEVRRWRELADHRQEVEAGRMAAYAAAVDELDQSVGRMIEYLDTAGLANNTLVIFLSDNGGDYGNGSIATDHQQIPWAPGSNPSSSNGWASVKCTPFRYYKHACHEGGIATPMVLRWPAGITQQPGTIIDVPTSITDIYPTLIELAGIADPAEFAGPKRRNPTGQTLLPLLKHDGRRESQPVFQWYTFSRAWIEDERKAVSLYGGPWQLFDLRQDRCEAHDRSLDQPEKLAQLVNAWQDFSSASGVPDARQPASAVQHGWGWHRLKKACPSLTSMHPANGSTAESTKIQLSLSFAKPVDFTATTDKRIYLYDVSDESRAVWQADPDQTHAGQGQLKVVFDDVPNLIADRHYAVRWDPGWIKVGDRTVGTLNDGAFWWRFRTADAK